MHSARCSSPPWRRPSCCGLGLRGHSRDADRARIRQSRLGATSAVRPDAGRAGSPDRSSPPNSLAASPCLPRSARPASAYQWPGRRETSRSIDDKRAPGRLSRCPASLGDLMALVSEARRAPPSSPCSRVPPGCGRLGRAPADARKGRRAGAGRERYPAFASASKQQPLGRQDVMPKTAPCRSGEGQRSVGSPTRRPTRVARYSGGERWRTSSAQELRPRRK
jgi:hypothetical protein